MKNLFLIMMFFCSVAFADESILFQGNWLHTPNSNYGDGAEGVIRVEKPIYRDLSLGVDFDYHGKTNHENFGWLSGYGFMGDVIFRPRVNETFKPYILGGLGWYWWDFRENSYLQDAGIKVDLGDSLGKKIAIGTDIKLNDQWSLNIEWAYFHSHVPKDSYYTNGDGYANVVGGDTVGQEETNLGIGLRYKF